jgi:Mrp family chromosome partitioning ATPase
MSKIYEALQLEQRRRVGRDEALEIEHKRREAKLEEKPVITSLPEAYLVESAIDGMEEEMIGLFYAVESQLPSLKSKIIQFVGSQEGEGASTLIHEFGRVAAVELGKSVLLFDADLAHREMTPGSGRGKADLELLLQKGAQIEDVFSRVGDLQFFICPVSTNGASPSSVLNSPHVDTFFERLKDHFDLILIDSPPISRSAHGLAICRRADGVVLVVEAENTRWPVVQSTKQRIQKSGGNILGMILNKRRYHIPSAVYNHI